MNVKAVINVLQFKRAAVSTLGAVRGPGYPMRIGLGRLSDISLVCT